ncbi:MAG: hypothetical protein ABI678_17845 [Kofleriaceae bacterium]
MKRPTHQEWVVGIGKSPSYVMEGGEPFLPAVVLALDVGGDYALSADVVRPEEVLDTAAGCVVHACAKYGARPKRLRVASAELAAVLGKALPGIEITVAATPEIDRLMASYLAHREGKDDGPASYLDGDATPDDVATFFAAAAELHRAQPWDATPIDGAMRIDCPALEIANGILVVVGQMGESFGLAVFPDRAAYDALHVYAETRQGDVPAQVMLHFDRREDLPPELVAEAKRHRWKVASPAAYPTTLRIDGRGGARPLTARELGGVTQIATVLARLIRRVPTVVTSWADEPPVEERAGDVVIVAPAPLVRQVPHAPREPAIGDLVRYSLVDEDEKLDEGVVGVYIDLISNAFARSPEARGVDPKWATMIIETAAVQLGVTLIRTLPDQLRDIVFAALPRSVHAGPTDAAAIIATARALLAFSARELGGYGPNWCLDALPADAVELLANELSDPANFSPAKQFLIEGMAAGFDMESEAGIAAWVAETNRRVDAKKPKKKPAAKKRR